MLIESKKISSNVTMYSADPIIYVVSNFISDQECDAFIIAAETNNKNGKERISLSLIHISEPTRLRRISYAVFCLKKKKKKNKKKKKKKTDT